MKRIIVGSLIVGVILSICPGNRSGLACLLVGALSTVFLLQLGPRSVAEKAGALLTAAAIAWLAGPRAATTQSLLTHVFGWTLASTALAVYLHPRAD